MCFMILLAGVGMHCFLIFNAPIHSHVSEGSESYPRKLNLVLLGLKWGKTTGGQVLPDNHVMCLSCMVFDSKCMDCFNSDQAQLE
jgi:hypothetical protein